MVSKVGFRPFVVASCYRTEIIIENSSNDTSNLQSSRKSFVMSI